jgi:hypothetical protein
MKIRLVRAALQKWLESQKEDAVVGQSICNTRCPIANYLVFAGDRYPVVSNKYRSGEGGHAALPKWARQFIGLIDGSKTVELYGGGIAWVSTDITQKQALTALLSLP